MIHLVSSAQAVDAAGLDYFFTNGHAIEAITRDFEGLINLNAVDWSVIPLKVWKDTLEDGDRKRRKQAEFLVHHFFPMSLIERIGVYSHQYKVRVEELLGDHELSIPVTVESEWYY